VLRDLLPLVRQRLGEGHRQTLNLLAGIANVEQAMGDECDHEARIKAVRLSLKVMRRDPENSPLLETMLGLALAYSDAGRIDEALEAYQSSVHAATEANDPRAMSQSLRNFGLFLADQEHPYEAKQLLRLAVQQAAKALDVNVTVKGLVALAIFLQHVGHIEEAEAAFGHFADLGQSAHPDVAQADRHWQALQAGVHCGCARAVPVLAWKVRRHLLERLPPGYLNNFFIDAKDGRLLFVVYPEKDRDQELNDLVKTTIAEALDELYSHKIRKD
jgi:tetratricopeptide (TPR) repeat protein